MSAELEWRWADPTGQQRAVRTDELRAALASGVIAPNTPVWRRGWTDWKPAYEVPELTTSALASANGVLPNIPPPPLFMVAVQQQFEDKALHSGDAKPPSGPAEPPPPPRYVPAPSRPPASYQAASSPKPSFQSSRAKAGAKVEPPKPGPEPRKVEPPSVEPSKKVQSPPPVEDDAEPVPSSALEVVPVPPLPTPSETLVSSPKPQVPAPESNTAVDMLSLSPSDAERLLGMRDKPATVATVLGVPAMAQPLPPPPPIKPASIPPPLPPKAQGVHTPPLPLGPGASAKASRPPAVPSRLPKKKKDTLLLFGGAPAASNERADAAPIVAPSPAEKAPRAVTQAPPFDDKSPAVEPEIPKAPPPMRARADSIEEISDAMLVDSESSATTLERPRVVELSASVLVPDASALAEAQAALNAEAAKGPAGTLLGVSAPEAQVPTVPPQRDREKETEPPADAPSGSELVASPSRKIIHDLRELLQRPRPRWVLPVAAFGVPAVLLGLIGLIVGAVRGKPGDEVQPGSSASASASTEPGLSPSSTSSAAAAATVTPGPTPSAVSTVACTVAGGPHVLAPKAMVPSGVEAVGSGNKLAIGFATGPKDGLALQVDPATLSVTNTLRSHSHDPIRRVLPLVSSKLLAAVDADRKSDKLASARTIAGDSTFVVGSIEGQLAWAAHASESPKMLWPLEGGGTAEALRGVGLADKGYVIAFRMGNAIWFGALHGDKSPNGVLSKVAGLGPQVGSPALAATDAGVVVAWADRASASDPWSLRWVRWTPGEAPEAAQAFSLPAGGLGEQAMSPALASLGGSRLLLVWTEGPVASHQVRAQTLSAKGQPLGSPLLVSAEGVNAGQGQAAVSSDGNGLVVFLASNGVGFEVVATPIACPM